MSVTTTAYRLHPVSAMARSDSPTTSSSTTSDRSPPPLSAHHSHRDSKTFLPPSTAPFSPIPTSARPRRPLSPSSLRDVDPPLDPERAFAARGKFPAPPTGHELMALFPPAPPPMRPGPTSGYFQHEERKFFAQAGKEIVRVRIEIDTPAARPAPAAGTMSPPGAPHAHRHPHAHPHPHPHPHPHAHRHDRQPSGPSPSLPPPPSGPSPTHSTSPRTHLPPAPVFPPPPSQGPPTLGGPGAPAHPGYPIHTPPSVSGRPPEPERRGVGGGAGEAMVVEDDDEAWRHPTPHNARRRAGKHTRRVIVK
ncbi:hypothetical protein TRAPUB_12300 [Trametes pubescens]|uniref:Uncharacterized protein n=1 Tax=Trametes pubescens TaxID=154538 RepID=A0A1M2VUB5_TRAPU|nr:hypothetical protein TRAPUB_12300 [Trametes pubescens]